MSLLTGIAHDNESIGQALRAVFFPVDQAITIQYHRSVKATEAVDKHRVLALLFPYWMTMGDCGQHNWAVRSADISEME